jgi:hypothetical protein
MSGCPVQTQRLDRYESDYGVPLKRLFSHLERLLMRFSRTAHRLQNVLVLIQPSSSLALATVLHTNPYSQVFPFFFASFSARAILTFILDYRGKAKGVAQENEITFLTLEIKSFF